MRYGYRCPVCGEIEIRMPIGSARMEVICPRCGAHARRTFSPFLVCVKRGRTDLDGSHLPETPLEKAYWKERAGVDVDRVQVAVDGFKRV
jgi:putative FmdB family regulatory protein